MDPVILYFSYDSNQPSGGQRDGYRHVDILRSVGQEALILHQHSGFRISWFDNVTPTVDFARYWANFYSRKHILVLPEDLGNMIDLFPDVPTVIHNKNAFYGWRALAKRITAVPDPYLEDRVVGILTVSEHHRDLLEFAYPSQLVRLVYPSVDMHLFAPIRLGTKKPQICYPAKAELHIIALQQILSARAAQGLNQLPAFDFVPLRGLSELGAAKVITESLILVSLNIEEGLAKVLIEAQAAGTLTITYECAPFDEVVSSEFRVNVNALIDIAVKIEAITDAFLKGDQLDAYQAAADVAVRDMQRFSPDNEKQALLAAWSDVLARV